MVKRRFSPCQRGWTLVVSHGPPVLPISTRVFRLMGNSSNISVTRRTLVTPFSKLARFGQAASQREPRAPDVSRPIGTLRYERFSDETVAGTSPGTMIAPLLASGNILLNPGKAYLARHCGRFAGRA